MRHRAATRPEHKHPVTAHPVPSEAPPRCPALQMAPGVSWGVTSVPPAGEGTPWGGLGTGTAKAPLTSRFYHPSSREHGETMT